MQFFEDVRGNMRPLTQIKRIGPGRDAPNTNGGQRFKIHDVDLLDDTSCIITHHERNEIESAPILMVPALPDTYLLGPLGSEDEADRMPWRTPIVAWAYTDDGLFYPYTVDGQDDGLSNSGPVLLPNGMVTEPGVRSWKSEADWIKDQLENRDQEDVNLPASSPSE